MQYKNISFTYTYDQTYFPHTGHGKVLGSTAKLSATEEFMIPIMAPEDAPVFAIVEMEAGPPLRMRAIDGVCYRPVIDNAGVHAIDLAKFETLGEGADDWADNPLIKSANRGVHSPIPRAYACMNQSSKSGRLPTEAPFARKLGENNQAEMRAKCATALGNLRIIDNKVWTEAAPPIYLLDDRGWDLSPVISLGDIDNKFANKEDLKKSTGYREPVPEQERTAKNGFVVNSEAFACPWRRFSSDDASKMADFLQYVSRHLTGLAPEKHPKIADDFSRIYIENARIYEEVMNSYYGDLTAFDYENAVSNVMRRFSSSVGKWNDENIDVWKALRASMRQPDRDLEVVHGLIERLFEYEDNADFITTACLTNKSAGTGSAALDMATMNLARVHSGTIRPQWENDMEAALMAL